MSFKYNRVLIKLSGEALGIKGQGINSGMMAKVVREIKKISSRGIKVAIVVGAGNWWRGKDGDKNITADTSDYMGMLAIVLNALALSDYLTKAGVKNQLYSYLVKDIPGVLPYQKTLALRDYNNNKVLIFAAGTGKPGVTSDTSAAWRARDLKVQAIFKVGLTDAVYSSNPDKNSRAKKYKQLNFREAIKYKLGVFDVNAYEVCRLAKIPLLVFKFKNNSLSRASQGCVDGSIITV
jgi:uridylate kinase